jgi:hypothetical protein
VIKKRIRGIVAFLCVFMLTVPAGALNASLNGRWISLQYGALTFNQAGSAFTAVWSGANASGSISGRNASFRYWSGASFEKCGDDSRGYGTLTLSDDGNTLSGSWANLSKKEPDSGSFTALRLPSINGPIPPDSVPENEEAPIAETAVTSPAPPDTVPIQNESSTQAVAGLPADSSGIETGSTPPLPDELNLTENLPPEYLGPFVEFLSDLEESVLNLFDVFDDDTGNETNSVPPPADELKLLPDNLPNEYGSELIKFLNDVENGVLKFFDIFDE